MDSMNPIIPIRVFENHKEEILSQMIEMRTRYGFRRFSLMAPQKSIRYSGFPGIKVFSDIGELLRFVNDALASHDIEVGWGCSSTIKQGPGGPYQYITGLDGKTSEIAYCPLDPDFSEVLGTNISTVADIAHPRMIGMMDDFTLGHVSGFGCFCPLHLEEFSRRQNCRYSREDLYDTFSKVTPESIRLRRAWAELNRDSLAKLATLIRDKIDRVSPETRILVNQPGGSDFNGDITEPVTRAFAGNTRPAVRLYGTTYGYDYAHNLPETVFHALYSAQHLPADFELYHESDTFPHTRFFMSAAKTKSLITAAFAYGMHDLRFNAIQQTDNPLEERSYADMFTRQTRRFAALKNAVKNCTVEGCEIAYDPFEQTAEAYGKGRKHYAWANVTGRLGIPHTSSQGTVKMVSGCTIETMSDRAIAELLRGAVFLDGKAAHSLCIRGFKDLIGAEVLPGGKPNFFYEGIHPGADFQNTAGKVMYNFLLFGKVGTEGGDFFQLEPSPEAKILTDFLDAEENAVTPGMIRFENELGGRVAITAFDLNNNSSSAVINYKKKEIMRQTIEWLGNEPLPVFVKHLPNMFCIFNRSQSGEYAVVVIISLCSDLFPSVDLDLAPQWMGSAVELLSDDGTWEHVEVEKQDRSVRMNTTLALMDPVIVKISRT